MGCESAKEKIETQLEKITGETVIRPEVRIILRKIKNGLIVDKIRKKRIMRVN